MLVSKYQIKNPCKDCKDRILGCHDKCKKYKGFKRDIELARAKDKLEKYKEV